MCMYMYLFVWGGGGGGGGVRYGTCRWVSVDEMLLFCAHVQFISFLFTETNLKGWIYDEVSSN